MSEIKRKKIRIIILAAFVTTISSFLIYREINQKKPAKMLLASNIIDYFPSITPTPSNTPTPTTTPTITPTPYPTNIPLPTQTPLPMPTVISITGNQLDDWFDKYSQVYSVDRDKLQQIAVCESNLNPSAVNGLYAGFYQFSPAAWKSTRKQMNLDPNPDLRFNPEEAIKTAAFKMSVSGLSAWPNCP
ncbi:transglycosylase SLT domain-containing protein [Patescibacteria group bacterium]